MSPPRNRRDEQGGAPIATYPLGSWSQFCRGRKPECPEETLEVRLRSTETRSTYNIVVEVEGVIDVHYASLTSQGVQHRVFYRDGHPSRHQPRPTGLNFGEQMCIHVFIKDGAYYCYCAYVLHISRYSDFLSPMLTNTGIFLRGLKLSGESRS